MKRGQAKINNKTVPLTDNTVIEEHLGECCGLGLVAAIQGVFLDLTVPAFWVFPPFILARW